MKIFLDRPLRVLLATNAAVLFSGAMLAPIYAVYVEKIGGDLMDASLTSGVFALVSGIVSLAAGHYTDKTKQSELIIALGYVILGVGFFLYTMVGSVFSLFWVQVVVGFGYAISAPSYDAVYSKHLDGHKSGTQWAFWESMAYIPTAAGAIGGGFAASRLGFDAVF